MLNECIGDLSLLEVESRVSGLSACKVAAQGYNYTTLTAPICEAHLKLCLFLLLACSCGGFAQNLRHFSTGEE